MTNQEIGEFEDYLHQFQESYEFLKKQIRKIKPFEYERWKAGGFIVDDDIMSMYPSLNKIAENILEEQNEEDEEEEYES